MKVLSVLIDVKGKPTEIGKWKIEKQVEGWKGHRYSHLAFLDYAVVSAVDRTRNRGYRGEQMELKCDLDQWEGV